MRSRCGLIVLVVVFTLLLAAMPGRSTAALAGSRAQIATGKKVCKTVTKKVHGKKKKVKVCHTVKAAPTATSIPTDTPTPTNTPTPLPTNTPTPTATPTATVPSVVSLSAPSAVDFGGVLYGQSSAQQMVSVANNGTLPTTIQQVVLQAASPGVIIVAADACTAKTLQPGMTCTVSLTFQPAPGSGGMGTLVVPYSGGSAPLTILLSGHGYYLQLTIPTIEATWTDVNSGAPRMVTASNGMACATATHFSSVFTINDGVAMNALSNNANHPLSQLRSVYIIQYLNNGALVWKAQMFMQVLGVGTGTVQVQVTAQTTGQGSTFQIQTPMLTPAVSQVDQCPANLQTPGV